MPTSSFRETSPDPHAPGPPPRGLVIRQTEDRDLDALEALSRRVYPTEAPWSRTYLEAHRARFPAGQLVALRTDPEGGAAQVVGMAASLRLPPSMAAGDAPYAEVTGDFRFEVHDPEGPTLYAAEVMVDPAARRQGIGAALYAARRELARAEGVERIRAAARLPGYGAHAAEMSLGDYVDAVLRRELHDATLTFQLDQGFRVVQPLGRYFTGRDRESQGYAVLIEWTPPETDVAEEGVMSDPSVPSTPGGHGMAP
ncbi:MAG TPA: GNAT family N-acetyltransferase [Polyangiaceae bacterium LLY-WYZ-14_1]|nr:GNAT family N-acetyltransferase [Polyangiaceae bacterium LLY-WYZ-14_1]